MIATIRDILISILCPFLLLGIMLSFCYYAGMKYYPLHEKVKDLEWRVQRLESKTGGMK